MTQSFVARWGASVFNCRHCGAVGMQWTEVSHDVWKPYDLINKEIHQCQIKGVGTLTREQVLEHLHNLGFEAYVPRTSSWKSAFIASNERQTIYFLIGKNGIDFKLYKDVRETKCDERGKLFTDGGEMVRNYYRASDVVVHDLIVEIANALVANMPIDANLTSGHGMSWRAANAGLKKIQNESFESYAGNDMQDIYDAVSLGDGEDAYLGDGMWIGSDGSMRDRGR